MKLKPGVAMNARPEVLYAIGVADAVYRLLAGRECVVTSFNDGKHGRDSLHYEGMAADLRTRDLPLHQKLAVFHALRALLEPLGFDVVLESDHIHLEYDPKAGEEFAGYTEA